MALWNSGQIVPIPQPLRDPLGISCDRSTLPAPSGLIRLHLAGASQALWSNSLSRPGGSRIPRRAVCESKVSTERLDRAGNVRARLRTS